jgi:hypothetical protein
MMKTRISRTASRDVTAVGLVVFVFAVLASEARAQAASEATRPVDVFGNVNVTSKGISLVPALTLGRPAAIFDLGVRKGRLSFEPQLRFALDGTPWSFLLWGRYRAVSGERFRLIVGGHPAFSFKTTSVEVDGRTQDRIEVRRYLAIDATPSWRLASHATVGGYYLYSNGFDPGAAKHTQMVAARASISNVRLFGPFVLQATPQIYYLRTSGQQGTYVGANASWGRRGSSWSIGTIVNQPIRSDVVGGKTFLWNVSANYAFK